MLGKRIKPVIVAEDELWVGAKETPGVPLEELKKRNVAIVKHNRRCLRKGIEIEPWIDPEIQLKQDQAADDQVMHKLSIYNYRHKDPHPFDCWEAVYRRNYGDTGH